MSPASCSRLTAVFRGYSMPGAYVMPMRMPVKLVLGTSLFAFAAASAVASATSDLSRQSLYRIGLQRNADNLSAREIERRVTPHDGGMRNTSASSTMRQPTFTRSNTCAMDR